MSEASLIVYGIFKILEVVIILYIFIEMLISKVLFFAKKLERLYQEPSVTNNQLMRARLYSLFVIVLFQIELLFNTLINLLEGIQVIKSSSDGQTVTLWRWYVEDFVELAQPIN